MSMVKSLQFHVESGKVVESGFEHRVFAFKTECHSPSFLSPLFIFKTASRLSFSLITLGGLNKTLFDAEPHFSIANK